MTRIILSILCLLLGNELVAQNVGIGTSSPNPSAKLDITSTNSGLLVPRMTTAQRIAIASPATGLLVFDNTTISFWYFDGTQWIELRSGISPFDTLGGVVLPNLLMVDETSDDFVFGSTQLDDDGNTAHNKRMFFDKSKGAFRVGQALGTEWDDANIGNRSFAMGNSSIASGNNSTAWGNNSTASAALSTAWGYQTIASGDRSTAWGDRSTASGDRSTAWGFQTIASGSRSTASGERSTASGTMSTAWGYETIASDYNSTAWGTYSTASAGLATAWGYNSTASGTMSTAWGYETIASGNRSTAAGLSTLAPSYSEVAFGAYNTNYTPNSTTVWDNADRLFVIGNGVFGARSNALTIYKNGTMNINDAYDMPTVDGAAGQVLTTNGSGVTSWGANTDKTGAFDTLGGVVFSNLTMVDETSDDFVFGSTQLDDDGNTAHDNRLFFDKSKGAFRAGRVTGTNWDEFYIGDYSIALGNNNIASGYISTAMGDRTRALGILSTTLGFQTTASGDYSTAMGYLNTALGNYSTAMGRGTTASGDYSTAMGLLTTALGPVSTAMGRATTASGSYSTAMGYQTTALGNYSMAMGYQTTASENYSMAMGRATIASGKLSIASGDYTIAPSFAEAVFGAYNTNYTPNNTTAWNNTDRLFVLGNGTTGARSDAFIVYKNGNATLAGTLTQSSDKRLKTNIQPLSSSLDNLLQLNGYRYNWKDTKQRGTDTYIGVLAQEVQALYPELVREDGNGYLTVDYSSLVPVLIEAIKEQQAEIENLKTIDKRLELIEAKLKSLDITSNSNR